MLNPIFPLILLLLPASSFGGTFKTPDNCKSPPEPISSGDVACQYEATWDDSDPEIIVFWVTMKGQDPAVWSGVGWNTEQQMMGGEAILAYGSTNMTAKEFRLGNHQLEDTNGEDQIVTIFNFTRQNGYTSFRFGRSLAGGRFELNSTCVYLLYPTMGGTVLNGVVQQHLVTPTISQDKVCFFSSSSNSTSSSTGPVSTSSDPSSTDPSNSTTSASAGTGSTTNGTIESGFTTPDSGTALIIQVYLIIAALLMGSVLV